MVQFKLINHTLYNVFYTSIKYNLTILTFWLKYVFLSKGKEEEYECQGQNRYYP